eukprot:CAMPEP_0184703616 /NCGR_PEP_ID=MMETSP0313-20130426/28467_1 /TAXON_ID=2792 /ORGANISM="Porphyridium aerugineum, Strain SAG 1380-2" /LENGTH=290 /DNA_ID=CAMNT_0027164431 /DNA_START=26 /DNA_END=898 /DNA_ORIENTATION=-
MTSVKSSSPPADKNQQLLFFVEHNEPFKVKQLLDAGANIQHKNEYGESAISLAAQYGDEELITLLLENKANIHDKTQDGSSALMIAALYGRDSIVQLLLEKGSNIHERDNTGSTCLMLAAEHGHLTTVQTLLRSGASIHDCDNVKSNSLMRACTHNSEKVVKLLLASGANIMDHDEDGETAMEYAKDHPDILRILSEFQRIQITKKSKKIMETCLFPVIPRAQKWRSKFEEYTKVVESPELDLEEAGILAAELSDKDLESCLDALKQSHKTSRPTICRMEFLIAMEKLTC